MTEDETAEEPLTVYKTLTLEGEATLGGLLNLLMRVPQSIPHEAEIEETAVYTIYSESDTDHEPRERFNFTLIWKAEEQP